jgi:hypothetical protein
MAVSQMIDLDKILDALRGRQLNDVSQEAKLAFARALVKKLHTRDKVADIYRRDAHEWQKELKARARKARHSIRKTLEALKLFQDWVTPETINQAVIGGLLGIDKEQLSHTTEMLKKGAESNINKSTGQDNIREQILALNVAKLYRRHLGKPAKHNHNFSTWFYRLKWDQGAGWRPTPYDKIMALIAVDLGIEFTERVLRDVCPAEKEVKLEHKSTS